MRSYLTRKSAVRVYAFVMLSLGFSTVCVFAGLLTVRKLDGYIHVMYYGNSMPIAHLANIRAAQLNIRRLYWKAFALRSAASNAECKGEINEYLAVVSREWLLYYPAGVSSDKEKALAGQLNSALPEVVATAQEFSRRLLSERYESTLIWYLGRVSLLDNFDRLLTANINTNVEQSADFAAWSKGILDRVFWMVCALFGFGAGAGCFVVLHWRRQRDSAERRALEHLWLVDQVFNLTMDGMLITDRMGRITKVNPAFSKMTGYSEAEILGKNPSLWSSGRQPAEFYSEMWRCIADEGQWQGKLWNRKKCGDLYLESLSITRIHGLHRADISYAAVCRDITQQHEELELQGYLATHDPLTGLPNRLLFNERLTQAIARGHRAGSLVAIMFVDLDHFKEINDNLGHTVGDATLMTVAARLKGCLRETDTVARLGGDEFAVLLEDVRALNQIEPVARVMLEAVGQVIDADGHQVFVTPSIGVSVYPDHEQTPQALVRLADLAMYEAKHAGKNAIRFHAATELTA